MTRLGMLVRCDDRGLGVQTWEAWRHLQPDRTVVVDMTAVGTAGEFPQHHDRYPDGLVARFDGTSFTNILDVCEHLADVDVIFSAETFYDWTLVEWTRRRGIATVLQGNPEFYRHDSDRSLPQPTEWWWPSPWKPVPLPAGPIVPVPVPDDAPVRSRRNGDGPLRVLYPGGHPALGDRNGGAVFAQALRQVRRPIVARIAGQGRNLPPLRGLSRHVTVEHVGPVADRWSLYEDVDVVVIPRRYGGLCLPAQEALAAGCALAMPDVEPNHWWPILPLRAQAAGTLRMPAGRIAVHDTSAASVATLIDRCATDPAIVAQASRRAAAWTEAHRWSVLLPAYRHLLAGAAHQAQRALTS